MSEQRLKLRRIIAYSVPGYAYMMVLAPVSAILPVLYSKHAAVDVASIGAVFLALRIFDAVTDPMIGHLSDRTRTALGPRKPWIIAAGFITMVAVYFLFKVPPDAGVVYFASWAFLFYLGATMYHVPHMAWGSELTADYSERARVFSIRGMLETGGNLTYALLPIALFYIGLTTTSEFSPDAIAVIGFAAAVLIPLLSIFAVCLAPTGHIVKEQRPTLKGAYVAARNNKPLLRFLIAYILGGAGTGTFAAMVFPYIDGYLKVGDKFPHMLLAANMATLISLTIWPKIVDCVGKHRAWAFGWAFNALAVFLLAFVSPGEHAAMMVTGCMIIFGFMTGATLVGPLSLLADIVDYDILKTGVDRAGNYYALIFFVTKITGSVGGLALFILGAFFGYQIKEGAVNDEFATSGLILLGCVVPALLKLAALPFIWNFPINKRRHDIIRRRIAKREKRALSESS